MNRDFWHGKRVFITGHTGFKGSWLALWLNELGCTVRGYSLPPPSAPSHHAEAGIDELIDGVTGDVRDAARLTRAMTEFGPEIVMHLAAQPIVKASYEDPLDTYTTNVIGSLNLLQAARQCPDLHVVLMITSDKCYENVEWVWPYRETDALGGHDPYSSSKACAEIMIDSFRRSYCPPAAYASHQLAIGSVRAGNVIGGGDWARDRLIPDIMQAIIDGRPVSIRAPNATRPWQHVLEALGGYLLLTERLWSDGAAFSEAWNFGPNADDIKPVQWITEQLTVRWGRGASWELDDTEHKKEANILKLDCTKAKNRLGWHPRLDLDTTLEWIIEWHAARLEGRPVREVSTDQIKRYEAIE